MMLNDRNYAFLSKKQSCAYKLETTFNESFDFFHFMENEHLKVIRYIHLYFIIASVNFFLCSYFSKAHKGV